MSENIIHISGQLVPLSNLYLFGFFIRKKIHIHLYKFSVTKTVAVTITIVILDAKRR